MNIDMSQLAPYFWFIASILVILAVIAVIRFFWHHILRYLVLGCLTIIVILILIEVLHYLKVF